MLSAPAVLLAEHRPVLAYDRRERDFATTVARWREPDAPHPDVVYGRVARQAGRAYLQYWFFSRYNAQDRGIVRTGRHEGDWEFAQLRIDGSGRPVRAITAQHKWAAACAWGDVTVRADGHPVFYVANGSHATYVARGEHGRPWPDPDDEAGGDGRVVLPRLVVLEDQTWLAYRGRWGGTPGSWVPASSPSPAGPRFQGDGRWDRPADYERSARGCFAGAPGRPLAVWFAGTLLAVAAAAAVVFGVRRRRRG